MPRPSFGVYPKGDDADPDYIEEVLESSNDLSQPHDLPRRSVHRQTPSTDYRMDQDAAESYRRARNTHSDTGTPLRSVTPVTTSTVDTDHPSRGGVGGKQKRHPSISHNELRRLARGEDGDEAPRKKRVRVTAGSSKVIPRTTQLNINQSGASSKSVFVNSPPSVAAIEMSALTGNFLSKKNAESFISFIQQGVFSEEYIRGFFPSTARLSSQPTEPEPIVMTAEEHILQAGRDNNMRRQVVLGKYGQGELRIDGQKARFKVVSRTERCEACTEKKRDCYRVTKDRFYTANTCAVCFGQSRGCSFNRTES